MGYHNLNCFYTTMIDLRDELANVNIKRDFCKALTVLGFTDEEMEIYKTVANDSRKTRFVFSGNSIAERIATLIKICNVDVRKPYGTDRTRIDMKYMEDIRSILTSVLPDPSYLASENRTASTLSAPKKFDPTGDPRVDTIKNILERYFDETR